MTRLALFIGFLIFYSACVPIEKVPNEVTIEQMNLPGISIRAIQALDDNTVWFSGSNGTVGFTLDGGLLWSIDSIPGSKGMELRSLSVLNDSTVLVLTAASPAKLFKTTNRGKDWNLVFTDTSQDVFFDSMKFWDGLQGVAFGDARQACFDIIVSRDAGNTWNRIPCENIPPPLEGEGAFAASNTNIKCFGQEGWIVTGGAVSRVLYTSDRGAHWSAKNGPIHQGGKMTGGFGLDMWDNKKGIVVGGNWDDAEDNSKAMMRTNDGGKNWELITGTGLPGFRSCVQYIPGRGGQWVMAVGYPGMDISGDGGTNWTPLNEESWYAFSATPSGNKAFLSGNEKIGVINFR